MPVLLIADNARAYITAVDRYAFARTPAEIASMI